MKVVLDHFHTSKMESSSIISKASPELTEKYKNILKANGITDEVSEVLLEINPASLKGAGMGSEQSYTVIKFKDPNVKPLNLFVKLRTSGKASSELHDAMKLFEKESRFFTEYVPAIKDFCKSNGQHGLVDFYPKCYYGDAEMLIFDNLVVNKGYILLPKKDRQGLESARLAMITLAKHHAISHAFIKHVGGPQAFSKRFLDLDYESFGHELLKDMVAPLIENGIATNIKIIEKSNANDQKEAIALLEAHAGKGFQMIMDALSYRPENEKILTLNHGDYWNNNMMFLRDEKTGKLHSHVAYDFQGTRYNSPALDIGNFMYTTMKPEVRRAHLKELLQLYLNVILDTANKLGSPIQLTFDELFHLYRRKFLYGFWFAIWLAADAAYAVINEVQRKDDEDVSDWSVQFDKLVQKWIDENPQKSKEDAESLVELMKEYASLVLE